MTSLDDDNEADFMPFGKYKGVFFSSIPVNYLDWVIGQDWVDVKLKEKILEHLNSRPEWKRLDYDTD